MIQRAEIRVPDNATWQQIEDAKIKAEWKIIDPKEERMQRTNLDGKCGSCTKYCPFDYSSYGTCNREKYLYRVSRTRKGCTKYERDDKKWQKKDTFG